MNIEEIIKPEWCTGCTSCNSVCPVQAIKMKKIVWLKKYLLLISPFVLIVGSAFQFVQQLIICKQIIQWSVWQHVL